MNTLSHRRALLGRASLSLALLGLCAAAGWTQSPGEIVAEQKLSDTAGGFTGDLGPFDNFGTSITSLGDLNGDGVTDLAVGASHNGDGNPLAGSVWVLFMQADGTVGSNVEIAPGQLGLTDLNQEHHFGAAVAFLGDLDGDGVGDLVVGAPRDDAEDAAASKAGALWILFLNADGTVDHHTKLSDQAFGAGGPGWFDGFGTSVAALGDLDGDGAPDLAAGSPTDSQGGPEAGAVWIAFL
ncbi:MAG TPA: integrin alpha, partial [Planctomycetota bacterium]|nr:integrin alpha [Planctomycetota bacterium]